MFRRPCVCSAAHTVSPREKVRRQRQTACPCSAVPHSVPLRRVPADGCPACPSMQPAATTRSEAAHVGVACVRAAATAAQRQHRAQRQMQCPQASRPSSAMPHVSPAPRGRRPSCWRAACVPASRDRRVLWTFSSSAWLCGGVGGGLVLTHRTRELSALKKKVEANKFKINL